MDVALDAAVGVRDRRRAPRVPDDYGRVRHDQQQRRRVRGEPTPRGARSVYCTFLGGGGTEQGSAIAVDAGGSACVAGFTTSTNFPISAGAVQSTFSGGGGSGDGFFAKISATGGRLDYGTYFGGSGYDEVRAMTIGVAPAASSWSGSTTLRNLQVPAGNFGWPYGIDEGFMARLDLPIATTSVLGAGWSPSSPVTALAILEPPVIGQLAIVTVMNAPPSTPGGIYVSSPASQSFIGAVPVYLNMADYVLLSSFTSTPTGGATLFYSLPVSAALAGAVAHAQAVLFTPASPYGIEVRTA